MAIADLKSVLKIFGGGDVSKAEQNALFKEVLLMTLARAADADINIQHVEVDRIREILKEHTGENFSAGDIRVAARDELYAEATLKKYLEKPKITTRLLKKHSQKPADTWESALELSSIFLIRKRSFWVEVL